MLETVDPNRKLDKATFQQWFPRLKSELRELQQKVREANIPVVVLFEGWAMSGKADCIRHLGEALDPRGFVVHTTDLPSEEEGRRPWFWRFWVRLPARSKFAFFERSWYTRVLRERVEGHCSSLEWEHAFLDINQTEELLSRDGTLVLKFWLQISRKEQRKRLDADKDDPFRSFDDTKAELRQHKRYEEYEKAVEEMLERTSTHKAPWIVVESGDDRFRRMKVLQSVCESLVAAINARESEKPKPPAVRTKVSLPVLEEMPSILDKVDLSKAVSQSEYEKRKIPLQVRIRQLQYEAIVRHIPTVIVYEGWDAAGKGGSIRRLTATMDPRFYDVVPIAKPTPEEKAYHYLWRFWRQVPKAGYISIYDRSWYGRVLVERIEGFCTEAEWRRGYEEINDFEMQLFRGGAAIIKFWFHITKAEQLRRFKEREKDPNKTWKLSSEDWRNRDKWAEYSEAVDEMVTRTSTTYAPWTIVEANCKRYARLKAMETFCEVLEKAIKRKG